MSPLRYLQIAKYLILCHICLRDETESKEPIGIPTSPANSLNTNCRLFCNKIDSFATTSSAVDVDEHPAVLSYLSSQVLPSLKLNPIGKFMFGPIVLSPNAGFQQFSNQFF